jgi:hypothetical protein
MEQVQKRIKKYVNAKRRLINFKEGNMVYISTKN